ncbi:DUF756 domain-containing protein [Phyllobacterium sp. LjRoot231]|uniref:phospholipase domain-containing protein n=1 Tax=Phyllobacterium sp. LjRoot231 TaxID=3342289 RepID=UPI003ECE0F85
MDRLIDTIQPVRIFNAGERVTARNAPSFKPTIADVNADPDAKKPVASKQDQTRCEILPLGYDFQVLAALRSDKRLQFTFKNAGKLGVAFSVLPNDRNEGAWFYSVEGVKAGDAVKQVLDDFGTDNKLAPGKAKGDYFFSVHGPNGYLAEFRGNANDGPQLVLADIVDLKSLDAGKTLQFAFGAWATANGKLKMVSAYTGFEAIVDNGTKSIDITTKDGWYDISFVDAVNTSRYLRRYAGHLENGKISKSDPAIGLKYDETRRVYVALTA